MKSKLFDAINRGSNGHYNNSDGDVVHYINLPGTEIRYEHLGLTVAKSTLRRWYLRGWINRVESTLGVGITYVLTLQGYYVVAGLDGQE